jgi:hypothetical protein
MRTLSPAQTQAVQVKRWLSDTMDLPVSNVCP